MPSLFQLRGTTGLEMTGVFIDYENPPTGQGNKPIPNSGTIVRLNIQWQAPAELINFITALSPGEAGQDNNISKINQALIRRPNFGIVALQWAAIPGGSPANNNGSPWFGDKITAMPTGDPNNPSTAPTLKIQIPVFRGSLPTLGVSKTLKFINAIPFAAGGTISAEQIPYALIIYANYFFSEIQYA